MNKFFSVLKRTRWMLITIAVFIALMVFVSMLSFTHIASSHSVIFSLGAWVTQNRIWFALWHGVIIVAIYFGWGWKVDRAAAVQEMSPEDIKKAKRFRYWMIAFVVVISLLTYWSY